MNAEKGPKRKRKGEKANIKRSKSFRFVLKGEINFVLERERMRKRRESISAERERGKEKERVLRK